MHSLRISVTLVALSLIGSLTLSASASRSDDDTVMTATGLLIRTSHHEGDDESREWTEKKSTEKLEKLRAKNAERVKKIQEKLQRAQQKRAERSGSGKTQSGIVTQPAPVTPIQTGTVMTTPTITRTTTVNYATPAGSDPVSFSVSVKSGIITAASATVQAKNTESIKYQERFASSLSRSVVGKKVSGLDLAAIGGASLTTTAFEKFVASAF